jgi:hypothetical protein
LRRSETRPWRKSTTMVKKKKKKKKKEWFKESGRT